MTSSDTPQTSENEQDLSSLPRLIKELCKHSGHNEVRELLRVENYGVFLRESFDSDSERVEKRIEQDIFGYLVTNSPEYGLRELVDESIAKELLNPTAGENFKTNELSRSILEKYQLYAPKPHQRNFGIESCRARVTELLERIPYIDDVDDPEELVSDLYNLHRGRVVTTTVDIDILITLSLVFYRSYFGPRDNVVDEVFEYVLAARNTGTGTMLSKLGDIEEVFRSGISKYQVECEKSRSKKTLDEKSRPLQRELRNNAKEQNGLKQHLAEIEKNIQSIKDQISQCLRNQVQELVKPEFEKNDQTLLQLNRRIEELERKKEGFKHLANTTNSQIVRLEERADTLELSLEELRKGEEDNINDYLYQRQLKAEDLQQKCLRLFGRLSPFSGFNIEKIRNIVDDRNDAAHSLPEFLRINNQEKLHDFLNNILDIIDDLEEKNVCPRTARVLGRWTDVYEREFVLLVDGLLAFPDKVWEPSRMFWVYGSAPLPFDRDEECFIIGTPGSLIFDPLIENCEIIVQQMSEFVPELNREISNVP